MNRITSSTDAENLSMTMVADFDAAPESIWNFWEDPRQLERWWGPPSFPVTFTRYEFEPGGKCRYTMTGPEDVKHHGWWRIDSIDRPGRIEFAVGPSDDDGEPLPDHGSTGGVVTFERIGSGTRMTLLTQFADTEQMDEMIGGGMEQGMRGQIGQIYDLLEAVHAG